MSFYRARGGGGGGGGVSAGTARSIAEAAVARAALNLKRGRFTLSSTRQDWGGQSTGSNSLGRVIADPNPRLITLTASGTPSAGISLASNVVTIRDAGLVHLQLDMQIEAYNSDGNAQSGGNNSRSDVECFLERAPAGSTAFAAVEESKSTTSYMRVAKPYWNHGPGEARVRTQCEWVAQAGDQFRVMAEAEFNQASTVTHAVIGGVLSIIQ